jgi:hypothetical protein
MVPPGGLQVGVSCEPQEHEPWVNLQEGRDFMSGRANASPGWHQLTPAGMVNGGCVYKYLTNCDGTYTVTTAACQAWQNPTTAEDCS